MSKNHIYTERTLELSLVGRALAHGARIEILKAIHHHGFVTNKEICRMFKLNVATIHDHVQMLIDADLVSKEYFNKFGLIRPTGNHDDLINPFYDDFTRQ